MVEEGRCKYLACNLHHCHRPARRDYIHTRDTMHAYYTWRDPFGAPVGSKASSPLESSRHHLPMVLLFSLTRSLLPVGKEHLYYCLIGVFWIRAGDDRLDVVSVCGLYVGIRCVLRGWPRLDTLDDHRRTLLVRTEASCHVNCGSSQLDCQLPGGNRVPESKSKSQFLKRNIYFV